MSDLGAQRGAGFSLIELAMVVVVLSLIGGGLVGALSAQIKAAKFRETDRTLREAEDALYGFAVASSPARLPCPDADGDGFEDLDPARGGCARPTGTLPWATLGAGRADGWGRALGYRPDRAFADAGGIPNPPDTGDGLKVVDGLTGQRLTSSDPHAPAAVIFSCGQTGAPDGPNAGAPAPGAAEAACVRADAADRTYAQAVPGAQFDDVLVWVSKNVLLAMLIRSGAWP